MTTPAISWEQFFPGGACSVSDRQACGKCCTYFVVGRDVPIQSVTLDQHRSTLAGTKCKKCLPVFPETACRQAS